jgi:hypothetical protein
MKAGQDRLGRADQVRQPVPPYRPRAKGQGPERPKNSNDRALMWNMYMNVAP